MEDDGNRSHVGSSIPRPPSTLHTVTAQPSNADVGGDCIIRQSGVALRTKERSRDGGNPGPLHPFRHRARVRASGRPATDVWNLICIGSGKASQALGRDARHRGRMRNGQGISGSYLFKEGGASSDVNSDRASQETRDSMRHTTRNAQGRLLGIRPFSQVFARFHCIALMG
jgi:hypothetical protein